MLVTKEQHKMNNEINFRECCNDCILTHSELRHSLYRMQSSEKRVKKTNRAIIEGWKEQWVRERETTKITCKFVYINLSTKRRKRALTRIWDNRRGKNEHGTKKKNVDSFFSLIVFFFFILFLSLSLPITMSELNWKVFFMSFVWNRCRVCCYKDTFTYMKRRMRSERVCRVSNAILAKVTSILISHHIQNKCHAIRYINVIQSALYTYICI